MPAVPTRPASSPRHGAAVELLELLGPLQRTLRRRVRAGWTHEPLPGAQVELLRAVAAHPGSSVGALAAEIGIAHNTASTLVNRLAAAGLVRREADPDDRRSSRVRLTPAAGERMGAWRERRLEVLEAALAALEPPELERLAGALPALRRLQRALDG